MERRGSRSGGEERGSGERGQAHRWSPSTWQSQNSHGSSTGAQVAMIVPLGRAPRRPSPDFSRGITVPFCVGRLLPQAPAPPKTVQQASSGVRTDPMLAPADLTLRLSLQVRMRHVSHERVASRVSGRDTRGGCASACAFPKSDADLEAMHTY